MNKIWKMAGKATKEAGLRRWVEFFEDMNEVREHFETLDGSAMLTYGTHETLTEAFARIELGQTVCLSFRSS